MKEEANDCWARINRVIEYSGRSINNFACSIGLPRGENLYQIKRGNNGVSLNLAKRINAIYPQFGIGWLMSGKPEPEVFDMKNGDPVVRIPVYCNLSALPLPPVSEPDKYLILSASEANGAEWATPYADEFYNPYLQNSIVLMKRHRGRITNGSIYMIVVENNDRIFRVVKECADDAAHLSLEDLPATSDFSTMIQRENVKSLWLVVGAICKW